MRITVPVWFLAVVVLAACRGSPVEPTVSESANALTGARATTITTHFTESGNRTEFNWCALDGAGEDVAVTFDYHGVIRSTLDANGQQHWTTHVQDHSTGVGLTTGVKYVKVGTTSIMNGTGGQADTFTNVIISRFIGPGPGNDLIMRHYIHATLVNGEFITSHSHGSLECR